MCTTRATVLTANCNFGSRKGVSNDSTKGPIEKKISFEEMHGWYEENHNGDWLETTKFVNFEPANEPLFYTEKNEKCA